MDEHGLDGRTRTKDTDQIDERGKKESFPQLNIAKKTVVNKNKAGVYVTPHL
jgi:hypothetical protein